MTENPSVHQARIQREASDAVTHRTSRGPVAGAVEAALESYLAGESYAAHDAEAAETDDHESPGAGGT